MRGTLWTVFVIGVLVLLLPLALNAAYADEQPRTDVDRSENLTVAYNTTIQLETAEEYREGETVTNDSDATLTDGVDYEFDSSDGTVEFLNTTNTTAGGNATIAYGAVVTQPTDEARLLKGLLAVIEPILSVLLFVVAVVVVLRMVFN